MMAPYFYDYQGDYYIGNDGYNYRDIKLYVKKDSKEDSKIRERLNNIHIKEGNKIKPKDLIYKIYNENGISKNNITNLYVSNSNVNSNVPGKYNIIYRINLNKPNPLGDQYCYNLKVIVDKKENSDVSINNNKNNIDKKENSKLENKKEVKKLPATGYTSIFEYLGGALASIGIFLSRKND